MPNSKKKNKIPVVCSRSHSRIPDPIIPDEKKITISFSKLIFHGKYSYPRVNDDQKILLQEMIEPIEFITKRTKTEINNLSIEPSGNKFHIHNHKNNDKWPNAYRIEQLGHGLKDTDTLQFGINNKIRLHGFFIDDTLYIRLIDPDHQLNPKN